MLFNSVFVTSFHYIIQCNIPPFLTANHTQLNLLLQPGCCITNLQTRPGSQLLEEFPAIVQIGMTVSAGQISIGLSLVGSLVGN